MAHFAKLGANGKVIQVLTLDNKDMLNADGVEDESVGQQYLETHNNWPAQMWIQTSYNTSQSVHKEGGTPFRANYAGITDTYDEVNDVFIPQNPYPDIWVLNETNWAWEAPIPYPDDGEAYLWDNEAYLADTNDPKTQGWVAVNP